MLLKTFLLQHIANRRYKFCTVYRSCMVGLGHLVITVLPVVNSVMHVFCLYWQKMSSNPMLLISIPFSISLMRTTISTIRATKWQNLMTSNKTVFHVVTVAQAHVMDQMRGHQTLVMMRQQTTPWNITAVTIFSNLCHFHSVQESIRSSASAETLAPKDPRSHGSNGPTGMEYEKPWDGNGKRCMNMGIKAWEWLYKKSLHAVILHVIILQQCRFHWFIAYYCNLLFLHIIYWWQMSRQFC